MWARRYTDAVWICFSQIFGFLPPLVAAHKAHYKLKNGEISILRATERRDWALPSEVRVTWEEKKKFLLMCKVCARFVHIFEHLASSPYHSLKYQK